MAKKKHAPPAPRPRATLAPKTTRTIPLDANAHQHEQRWAWSSWSTRRRAGIVFAAAGAYSLAAYAAYTIVSPKEQPHEQSSASPSADVISQEDRRDVYDSIATRYDADIAMDELVMGLLLLRRWVVGKAEGDTLELAAGTARNLAYYDPRHVTSLTLTDASDPMLDRARAQLVPNNALKLNTLATARGVTPTTVAIADATGLPYADGTFDTVVSTFSLCSVSDPAAAVREAMRVVRPGGGRVWMLEHGRAHYSWLNRLLDANAPRHADTWGCWFNRDIGDIVTRAVESGQTSAHVERIWRTHFGTTWIVEIVRD